MGPGLVLAATGVGAGDVVAGTVSGSRFGLAVAWAAIVGALVKLVLTEALARWQLATGTTLLEGWARHLGRTTQLAFLVYLVLWSFVVGGALISACGLAAHAMCPALSVGTWGVIHSLAGVAIVLAGGYGIFERVMAAFVVLMFVTLVGAAFSVAPPLETASRIAGEASLPAGAGSFVLATIGGVGGSVTLLSYGYWIRERGWEGRSWLARVRTDLVVGYVATGAFGVAVIVLAANVLHGSPVEGAAAVPRMAEMLVPALGNAGRWAFLVGFWGAVATSLLGVWQGVPYLFCEFMGSMRGGGRHGASVRVDPRSRAYRGFLVWLAGPPLVLLVFDRPVTVIVAYTLLGALFMPFLSATLLYLNTRRNSMGELCNGWWGTLALMLILALFVWLGSVELIEQLAR